MRSRGDPDWRTRPLTAGECFVIVLDLALFAVLVTQLARTFGW